MNFTFVKPSVNFNFSPEEAFVINENMMDVKTYIGYIANKISSCAGCGAWGTDHESGGGMGYSCPSRQANRFETVSVGYDYQNHVSSKYLLVKSNRLNDVKINFGSEYDENAKLVLAEWNAFLNEVKTKAALYTHSESLITFTFDFNQMTKADRTSLQELCKKYELKK